MSISKTKKKNKKEKKNPAKSQFVFACINISKILHLSLKRACIQKQSHTIFALGKMILCFVDQ